MSLGFEDRTHASWHQIYTNGRPNARLTAGLVHIAKLCLYHFKMHNNWRFFDRLRLGSVTNRTGWGLPDPGFVRGPTYVILPVSQRKMEVPSTRRAHVVARRRMNFCVGARKKSPRSFRRNDSRLHQYRD